MKTQPQKISSMATRHPSSRSALQGALTACALILTLSPSHLPAQTTRFWNADLNDGLWSSANGAVGGGTTTNWSDNVIPAANEIVVFAEQSLNNPNRTIDLEADRTVQGLVIQDRSVLPGFETFTLDSTVGTNTLTIGAGSPSLANHSIFNSNALGVLNCNVQMDDTSGDNTFSILLQSAPITINGVIGGSNTLQLTGDDTLILANANICTGTVSVLGISTLEVTNSAGSATGSGSVEIGATGALTGNGRIGGNTTVDGTISPGSSTGTLTLDSDLTLLGTYECELDTSTSDRIDIGGTFNAGGTLNLSQLATPSASSYTLLTADQINGQFDTVIGLPIPFQLVYNANSITLERAPAIHVDASATGANSGFSWTDALTSLQDAIDAAIPGDEIRVAEGTYYPDEGSAQTDGDRSSTFHLKNGVTILGGFPSGGGTTPDPVANSTILSGDLNQDDGANFANNGENAYHVVTGTTADNTAEVIGFTITAGNADGVGSSQNVGGGLICDGSGSPSFSNCIFLSNQASFGGGGIFNISAAPTFTNCVIQGNQTTGLDGGGVHNISSSPVFVNSAFLSNQASSQGGAVTAFNFDADPVFINCSFQGNQSGNNGGAIYLNESLGEFTNCIIWRNQTSGVTTTQSASLRNDFGTPTFSHCLIENWTAAQLGGTGSLDGTNAANDPLFLSDLNPANAPISTGGDLRLSVGSPALEVGLNSANSTALDLAGNPRLVDSDDDGSAIIDLGAHETRSILYVDASATTGTNTGESWSNAFLTLQSALVISLPGNEIRVAAGTYYPDEGSRQTNGNRNATFRLRTDVSILGGYPIGGGPTRDHTTNPTILSGDLNQDDGGNFTIISDNARHVVTGTNTQSSAEIDGFTITAGNSGDRGGGLTCLNSGSPTVANCTFLNNRSSVDGAAIGLGTGIETIMPTIIGCTFQGNRANDDGSAIYINAASATIINCIFFDNRSGDVGGAIASFGSNSTIINCSFQGNQAGDLGGALYLQGGEPIITNCSIQGNQAVSGGGVYNNSSDSDQVFTNCIIWNNQEGSSTTSPNSSVVNSGGLPSFTYCLIENWNATDLGDPSNLDGTDPANNPLFTQEIDPATAPASGGDLHLLPSSPCIDVGLNSANPESFDINGNPRIAIGSLAATIDLGAYEFYSSAYQAWIEQFFPGETDPSIIGPGATPTENGLINALSFALNRSPLLTGPVQPFTTTDSAAFRTFGILETRKAGSDFGSFIEYSTDLENFTRVPLDTATGTIIESGIRFIEFEFEYLEDGLTKIDPERAQVILVIDKAVDIPRLFVRFGVDQ